MSALILIFVALLGLAIGSFINMAVWRTHADKKWTGRSRCVHCDEILRARDLLPVVSFLLLHGRCRSCRKPISWQYPIVEMVTAILFVLAFLRYTSGFSLPDFFSPPLWVSFLIRDWILMSFLIALTTYDFRFMELPDRFTLTGAAVALIFNLALGAPLWSLLLGGATLAGFFLVQALLSKGRWVGGGDVRLGLFMGLALGIFEGAAALLIAYVAGALVAVYLLARKRVTMQSPMPFGVVLALTTIVLLLAGQKIINILFFSTSF